MKPRLGALGLANLPGHVGGKRAHKFFGGPLEFDEAKRQAETWLAQLAGSAGRRITPATVREALGEYVADLRREGRLEAAQAAEGTFQDSDRRGRCCRLELKELTRATTFW